MLNCCIDCSPGSTFLAAERLPLMFISSQCWPAIPSPRCVSLACFCCRYILYLSSYGKLYKPNKLLEFIGPRLKSTTVSLTPGSEVPGQAVALEVDVNYVDSYFERVRQTNWVPNWPGLPAASREMAIAPWATYSSAKVCGASRVG